MSTNYLRAVEFFGGPIDGHIDGVAVPMKPFLAIKTVAPEQPVSSLRLLWRLLRLPEHHPPAILAVYEMQTRDAGTGYYYLRSVVATDCDLNPIIVDAMVQRSDLTLGPLTLADLK
ncbi:hypothetical protein RMSM_01754 [Rhodopirellula maiorica SM1]|uniref:Uncharacterized protein n=1 Tax=Rhodopirellula maiorica SM1 TaxID=1265738 RepID=M5S566_9BACT|nr:hypothetical protein [Rhodopirellula maiorica]EMI21319.1 hypothetical protein RMSM_01754 [Rhodopirellula maiorica SM1]